MADDVDLPAYVLQGGMAAADRLAILDELCWPSTASLLDDAGLGAGWSFLDVGCGTGRVTLRVEERVGPTGRCVGVDADAPAIEIATSEAERRGASSTFVAAEATAYEADQPFDLVFARFVLSHCADPAAVLAAIASHAKPGGVVVVEDVHFPGHFCSPPSPAFDRYLELYQAASRARGGDPLLGVRLPQLLEEAGLTVGGFHAVVPLFADEPGVSFAAVTLDGIRASIVDGGLASDDEVSALVADLFELARTPGTRMSVTRICQAWATTPA